MKKTISVSNSMPLTLGIIAGSFVASYWFSGLNAEFEIGRPSSTASIGYIFAPIYAGIVGLIGVGVGFIVRAALKGRGERDQVKRSKFYLVILSILILSSWVASNIATQGVVAFEEFSKPKLISNKSNFLKTQGAVDVTPSAERYAELVWDYEKGSRDSFLWGGVETQIGVKNDTVMGIQLSDAPPIEYDVRNYSYITEISAIKYSAIAGEANYLVVLVKLRATSSRSLLLIYDQKHELVYEELLERCGRIQYMGVADGIEGEEVIVSICSPFSLTARPNKSLQPTL